MPYPTINDQGYLIDWNAVTDGNPASSSFSPQFTLVGPAIYRNTATPHIELTQRVSGQIGWAYFDVGTDISNGLEFEAAINIDGNADAIGICFGGSTFNAARTCKDGLDGSIGFYVEEWNGGPGNSGAFGYCYNGSTLSQHTTVPDSGISPAYPIFVSGVIKPSIWSVTIGSQSNITNSYLYQTITHNPTTSQRILGSIIGINGFTGGETAFHTIQYLKIKKAGF